MQVNHRDGDKRNNRPENLEYVTGSQNNRHRLYVLGQIEDTKRGERHELAKLTDEIVRGCRARHANGTKIADLAREFDVHFMTMSCAIHGRTWKHVA